MKTVTTDKQVEPVLEAQPRLLACPLLGHLPDKGEFTSGPYIAVSGAPDMPKFYAVVCPGWPCPRSPKPGSLLSQKKDFWVNLADGVGRDFVLSREIYTLCLRETQALF